jgi:hypothetical protein
MTRLSRLFKRAAKAKDRKQAKKRAYRSATMAFKMELVERETRTTKDKKHEEQ